MNTTDATPAADRGSECNDQLGLVPKAWVGPFGLTMHHEIYTAWAKQYPEDARKFSPLYDAATIDAQVAAERERCAQRLEAMAARSPDGDTDRDALLAAANELRRA